MPPFAVRPRTSPRQPDQLHAAVGGPELDLRVHVLDDDAAVGRLHRQVQRARNRDAEADRPALAVLARTVGFDPIDRRR